MCVGVCFWKWEKMRDIWLDFLIKGFGKQRAEELGPNFRCVPILVDGILPRQKPRKAKNRQVVNPDFTHRLKLVSGLGISNLFTLGSAFCRPLSPPRLRWSLHCDTRLPQKEGLQKQWVSVAFGPSLSLPHSLYVSVSLLTLCLPLSLPVSACLFIPLPFFDLPCF